jgi:urea transport system permease protein
VLALPDGLVGWWRQGGPSRLIAMVGWTPRSSTYPALELDPQALAEQDQLEHRQGGQR